MLQTSALASTCCTCFGLNNLQERFIGVVLDVCIQDLQLPIADQGLVDPARKRRIIETHCYPKLR
jgi:hypothetical protein